MQLKNRLRGKKTDSNIQQQRSTGFQGGYGSSSLKECIELLNATSNYAPAPLDSGLGQKSTESPQNTPPTMSGTDPGSGPLTLHSGHNQEEIEEHLH